MWNTDTRNGHDGRAWSSILRRGVAATVLALAASTTTLAMPVSAQTNKPGDTIDVDFTASAPVSYNHYFGGGYYEDGTSNQDTVQSLEGADFACGDIVSFMTLISANVDAAQYGAMTAQLHYHWDMAGTGAQTGVGYGKVIGTRVNYGTGASGETAIVDDGGSTATVVESHTVGSLWVSGSTLYATIGVDDIEANEVLVVRTDVKLYCDPNQADSNGTLQSELDDVFVTAVTSGNGSVVPSKVNSGQRTVPMNSPGGIHYPQISLSKTVTTASGTCPGVDSMEVQPGQTVKYCYAIHNPSNVMNPPGRPILQVRLHDDNATPGNAADDFWVPTASITGLADLDTLGDANDLAPGATAYASVTKLITGTAPMTITNTAIAYGDDAVTDPHTLSYTDTASVLLTDILPDISVTKTASPTHVSELGGNVTYTVTVTNNAPESFTLNSLTDDRFGNLDGVGTCDVPATIAALGTSSCTFTRYLTGEPSASHTNVVTASGIDPQGNPDTATDDAVVSFDNVMPDISVTKTANPTSVPELGGTVTFTVVVSNATAETLTLTTLTDSVFGNLNGKGTCATGGSIAGGGTYTCAFTETLAGEPAAPHTDTVTAVASDNDGNSDTASDDAMVTFDNVMPDISVTKTANPTHVSELGGAVTFTVVVSNNTAEALVLTSLTDTVFGDLNGKGSCVTGGTIAGSGTYTCTFDATLSGEPAAAHTDTVTAVASDNDGNSDTASDDATVAFDDVLPDISVTKTPSLTHVSEFGGDVVFTVVVTNNAAETVTLTGLVDSMFGDLNGQGTCVAGGTIAASGGTYTCTFTRHLVGEPATPHSDTVTATAADNDGNSDTATATAMVTFDNEMPSITVTKTPNPTHVSELGGDVTFTVVVTNNTVEALTLFSLVDSVFGDLNGLGTCATGGTIAGSGSYSCTFTRHLVGEPATAHVDTVTAVAKDNESNSATDDAMATVSFDDMLPDITLTKTANPTVVQLAGGPVTFTVVVHNLSAETGTLGVLSDSMFGDLNGKGTCLVPQTIAGGGSYTCSFVETITATTDPTAIHTDTVTGIIADDDGNTDTATDDAVVMYTWYGRTPGYWKNHLTVWPTPYTPTTKVISLFTIPGTILNLSGKPDAGDSLADALGYKGGSTLAGATQILLRAAVAAVLNAQYYGAYYPQPDITWIVTQVNAKLMSADRAQIVALATLLDFWNNAIHDTLP